MDRARLANIMMPRHAVGTVVESEEERRRREREQLGLPPEMPGADAGPPPMTVADMQASPDSAGPPTMPGISAEPPAAPSIEPRPPEVPDIQDPGLPATEAGPPPMPGGVQDPGFPPTMPGRAQPLHSTPGTAQEQAQQLRRDEIDRLMKPTPTWRKVLGGVLMAVNRPAGSAVMGLGNRDRALYVANQMADDERMQRQNEAQEAIKRDTLETGVANRRVLQTGTRDVTTTALVRALSEGFIPLSPNSQPPEGHALVKIGDVSGYQLTPGEFALQKRSMSYVGMGPQGIFDPNKRETIYADPEKVAEVATAKRPTVEEVRTTSEARAEGRAAGTPAKPLGAGRGRTPTQQQKLTVDRETGNLQREFGNDMEAAATAARERIKDGAILNGVLTNLGRGAKAPSKTGGGFFPAGFDPFAKPKSAGAQGSAGKRYTEQQVRQAAQAAGKDANWAVQQARQAQLIP